MTRCVLPVGRLWPRGCGRSRTGLQAQAPGASQEKPRRQESTEGHGALPHGGTGATAAARSRPSRSEETRLVPAAAHGVTLGPGPAPAPAGPAGTRDPPAGGRGASTGRSAGSAPSPPPSRGRTHMCGFRWKALRMSFTTRCTSTATSSGDSAMFPQAAAGALPGQRGRGGRGAVPGRGRRCRAGGAPAPSDAGLSLPAIVMSAAA